MKNIKINLALFISGIALFSFTSCEDQGYDEYEQETVPTIAMNGEWMIEISDAATGEVVASHAVHKMYEIDGQVYISDRVGSSDTFTGWWLETPLDVNLNSLTFSATDQLNTADESVVTITNGQIFKNAAHSPSGVVTDSIYFEGVFDYDPTTTLEFAGFRRTGFLEDE